MTYLFCGLIIGMVMGLTGAGGALIAIPLFMQFLGMELKEASVYSLVAVIIASLLNFIPQRESTQYRTSFVIVFTSALGSFIATPFKESLPTIYVAITLTVVSIYALYSVWFPAVMNGRNTVTQTSAPLLIMVGLILGVLTTFTGLGGGVLMLPVFLNVFHYSQAQAVGTSLLAVGLSALASFLIQISRGSRITFDGESFWLVGGILISVFVLSKMTRRLSVVTLEKIRQILFTVVVLVALIKVI